MIRSRVPSAHSTSTAHSSRSVSITWKIGLSVIVAIPMSIAAFRGARKTDRLPWLSDHARQRCAKANCAAISDEHYQHARQREAEEKHRPVQDIKTQEPAHGRFTREHVGLNFFEQETLSTL